jgi:predicted ABC-type ATPase
MVAGPNGSGKSTLIGALRADARFDLPATYINADDLQRERGIRDPRAAQQLANDLRAQALLERRDVMYETVMSHPSKIAELQQARTSGYDITVVLVATNDPGVNVQRVAARVAAGGHDVPEDRTRERYGRTLALAPVAIGYAQQAAVFDNTRQGDTGGGLREQAALAGERLVYTTDNPVAWVRRLAEQVNARADELRSITAAVEAKGLPAQLARLDDNRTIGPIVLVNQHYVLQYDERARVGVIHDRALLGTLAERLAPREAATIDYKEGVAAAPAPRRGRTRGE